MSMEHIYEHRIRPVVSRVHSPSLKTIQVRISTKGTETQKRSPYTPWSNSPLRNVPWQSRESNSEPFEQ